MALGADVGSGELRKLGLKVGDRVAGLSHGCEPTTLLLFSKILILGIGARKEGAFAEYIAAFARVLLPIPDSWTFEQAAQVSIAMYTASLCLYYAQGLPTPFEPATEPIDLLVWGGASSVGQSVVQLAHLGRALHELVVNWTDAA